MLTLTRKSDYALIALTHLARDGDGCSSAREISEQYQMPLPLLMNVLKQLTQRGLAKSVRGPRGGYTLAVSADEITLKDIIQAVEGPISLVRCAPPNGTDGKAERRKASGKTCDLVASCPVRSAIHRVHDRLIHFLDDVTLAEVAEDSMGESGSCCGPNTTIMPHTSVAGA